MFTVVNLCLEPPDSCVGTKILEGLLEFQLPMYVGKSSDNFNNWCTIQAGEVL